MNKKQITLLVAASLLSLQAMTISAAHADELLLNKLALNSTAGNTHEAVTLPQGIGNLYSDMNMRMHLAAKQNVAACVADECLQNLAFDARVKNLGAQLVISVSDLNPKLKNDESRFEFAVADKQEIGAASNSAGKIVVFRGLQNLELTDEALSFIIAREMGHVIARHHDKNTATKLIITALASVIFPVAGIIHVSSAAAQATTATTLLTSAASTATSMLGSQVAMAKMKPTQLAQSDDIAVNMLLNQHYDLQTVISTLEITDANQTAWEKDLKLSLSNLEKRLIQNDMSVVALAADMPINRK